MTSEVSQCPDWNGQPVASVSSRWSVKAAKVLPGSLEVCVCVCELKLELKLGEELGWHLNDTHRALSFHRVRKLGVRLSAHL